MATKKAKKKASKKKSATKKASAKKTAERKDTITHFVRARLKQGHSEEKVLKAAEKAFPKKKPTMGYVRWIGREAGILSQQQ